MPRFTSSQFSNPKGKGKLLTLTQQYTKSKGTALSGPAWALCHTPFCGLASSPRGETFLVALAGIVCPPCGNRLRVTAQKNDTEWWRGIPQRNVGCFLSEEEGEILDRRKQQMFTIRRLELLAKPSDVVLWGC